MENEICVRRFHLAVSLQRTGKGERINGILRRFTKLRDGIASASLCDTVIPQPVQDAANHCASIEWSAPVC